MYQLCLGDERVASVIDRITERACQVAPALDHDRCRQLVALIFIVRLRRTAACGTDPACRPDGPLLGIGTHPRPETAQWLDADPRGLPDMFAAAAMDLIGVGRAQDPALALRLAAVFRSVIRPLLFCNPRCGQAAVCGGEPMFDDLDPVDPADQIDGDPEAALSA